MLELNSSDKAKVTRLKRQLKHVAPESKEALDLRSAIKKVKRKAKER